MSLNIGNQQSGTINNAAGDITIYGGQHTTVESLSMARQAVHELGRALDAAPITASEKAGAKDELDAIESELRQPAPDKPTLLARVANLTKILAAVGALTNAGSALALGITSLASWVARLV